MKKATSIIFILALLSYCAPGSSQDCVLSMLKAKNLDPSKLKYYQQCILNSVDTWYQDHYLDEDLFDMFQKLSVIDKSNNDLDTLLQLPVDDRIKAAYILFFTSDSEKCYHSIKDTGFAGLVKVLKNNESFTEQKILSVLNSNDLNSLLFFLSYISFEKEKRYSEIIFNIDTSRFSDEGNPSERYILETNIDLAYGALTQQE